MLAEVYAVPLSRWSLSMRLRALVLFAALVPGMLISPPAEPQQRRPDAESETKAPDRSPDARRQAERGPEAPVNERKPIEAKRKITIAGQEIAYTATLGEIILRSSEHRGETAEDAKQTARISYISYTLDGASLKDRPVIFAWNGGPGSASIWLHVGLLGPKRAILTDDGRAPPLPGGIVPNEETLLRYADIVLIDPVGTGFSRALKGEKLSQFFGYNADVSSVGEFVREYVTRHGRWASPKYLLGESYGGARVAGLSDFLQSRLGMSLNGVIVVSGAINYQTILFQPGNDLPYGLFLPSYAATAWYHKRVAPIHRARPLADFLAEVEAYAAGEYQSVLFKGTTLKPAEREAAVAKLAAYTGLSPAVIDEANLRINAFLFFRELLRAEGKLIGRYDGRYTTDANPNAQPFIGFDPSVAELQSAYRTALELILKEEIGVKAEMPLPAYETGSGQALVLWDFGAKNRFFDSTNDLQRAMIFNPQLKLFVAEGYYDLATAYRTVDYTLEHFADGRQRLKDRIVVKRYEAGHMMYSVTSIRKALARDLGAFITSNRPAD